MALIKCPECGKEVSDTAKSCPYCGYNVNQYTKYQRKQEINAINEHQRNIKAQEISDNIKNIPLWKKIAITGIVTIIALLVIVVTVNRISYNSTVNNYTSLVDKFVDDWYTLQKYEDAEKKDYLSIDIYNKALISDLHKLSKDYAEIKHIEEVMDYIQTKIKAEMIFPVIAYNNTTTGPSYDFDVELLDYIKYYGHSVSDLQLTMESGDLYCTGVFKNERDYAINSYLKATAYFFDKEGNIVTETTYGLMGIGADPLSSGDTKSFKIEAYTNDINQIVSCDISIHN